MGLVPVYDPPTGEQPSVDAWTKKVNDLAEACAWSYKQAISFAITKLQGVAKIRHDSLLIVQVTWPEW